MAVRISRYGYWTVLLLVVVADMIAFGLAIAGEVNRSKPTLSEDETHYSPDEHFTYCKYNTNKATGYGIAAMISLLLGHLAVIEATKCFCCGGPYSNSFFGELSQAVGWCSLIIVWFSFLLSEALLLVASSLNAVHTEGSFEVGTVVCSALRKGVFTAGAIASFLTMLYSVTYYTLILWILQPWLQPTIEHGNGDAYPQ